MRKITRRFVGGFAAATLSVALVACSDAKEAADDAKDAAGSVAADATDAAGSAASKATEAVGSAAAEATGSKDDKAEGAKGDTQTITTAHGDEEVPADLAAAVEEKQAEWGEVENVESSDEGTLVAFEGGKYLVYSEQTGVQPVIGKIAETWVNEGGLASSVGLPTKPEAAATNENGWTQQFSNGTISWTRGDDGTFRADVDS